MKKEKIYESLEELLKPLIDTRGIELVDVTYEKEGSKWFLRIYVDKPGGIQLSDCEEISRFLSEKLDAVDLIPHQYYLEVSSPGIERPLRKPEDFIRFRGSDVALRTNTKIQGRKNFSGRLIDYIEDQVVLETEAGTIKLPINSIGQAKLKVF